MSQWLKITKREDRWIVADDGQLRRLVQSMSDPNRQYPSVLTFIGKQSKSEALRVLFRSNNTRKNTSLSLAKLHLSETAVEAQYPTLVIDGNIDKLCDREIRPGLDYRQSQGMQYEMSYEDNSSYSDLRDLIYSLLIFPFSHIIYIFSDDIGGPETTRLLTSWLEITEGFKEPILSRPKLVIVFTDPNANIAESDLIDQPLREALLSSLVSDLSTIDLRKLHVLSPDARFLDLHAEMTRDRETVRNLRDTSNLLFTATHIEALFRKAMEHLAREPHRPFNSIKAAREGNDVAPNASRHLQSFIKLVTNSGKTVSEIAICIASALIMDAYPNGMHKFNPLLTFNTHYSKLCHEAWTAASSETAKIGCDAIKLQFCFIFTKLKRDSNTAIYRKNSLEKQSSLWAPLRSNTTCLSCLLRGTDEMLPCGHAICTTCVKIWGERARRAEYHYNIPYCVICQRKMNHMARDLPPTKRPDLLVLDGGGVRGIITLKFLLELERRRSGRPIREDIDLNMGTSVGAPILVETAIKRSSARHAMEIFKPLVREIFTSKSQGTNHIAKFVDFLRRLWADALYDSTNLNSALQKTFGTTTYLFDVPCSPPGVRVALTTSQVESDGTVSLFSNYRHFRNPGEEASYTSIMPENVDEEPLLWQVVRCCVAALSYFKAQYLQNIGTLQDAGILANCPLKFAIREAMNIWPDAGRPDLVVSIGTGYARPKTSKDCNLPSKRTFHNGFIGRGLRAFLFSPAADGKKGFEDALDDLSKDIKEDIFRLDKDLGEELPELDNVEHIDQLSQIACEIPSDLARALLTTSFFFELDEEPSFTDGQYRCNGSILCSRSFPEGILALVEKELPSARFTMHNRVGLGLVQKHDGCKICGYYRKQISFYLSSLYEDFRLEITSRTGSRKIGGFPTSLTVLLKRQQAYAVFGRSDHKTDQWPPSRKCYCSINDKPINNKRLNEDPVCGADVLKRKKVKFAI